MQHESLNEKLSDIADAKVPEQESLPVSRGSSSKSLILAALIADPLRTGSEIAAKAHTNPRQTRKVLRAEGFSRRGIKRTRALQEAKKDALATNREVAKRTNVSSVTVIKARKEAGLRVVGRYQSRYTQVMVAHLADPTATPEQIARATGANPLTVRLLLNLPVEQPHKPKEPALHPPSAAMPAPK